MKRVLPVLFVLSAASALLADDAAEYEKRAKKLEVDEGLGRVELAEMCETSKMWKEAVDEWSRVVDVFPDNKEGADHLGKAQERAGFVESRPDEAQITAYKTALASLRKGLAKKWRDLAAWAKSKNLGDEEAAAVAMAEDFESTKKEVKGAMGSAVAVLNAARRKCKTRAVVLGDELTKGAQKHADYLIRNDSHPSTKGLGCHQEQKDLPGYSPEGEKAGHESDIGSAPPPQAMAGMLSTFYHRIPLLHPDLNEVGIGYAKGASWGGRCVIDFAGKGDKDEKAPRIVAYPPEDSTGNVTSFSGEEPNPIPEGTGDAVGLPVTLSFFDGPEVTDATMTVTGPSGAALDGWLSSPAKPARSDFPNEHSICFIPKKTLAVKAKYHVKVTAKVDAQDYAKEWDFTTGTR